MCDPYSYMGSAWQSNFYQQYLQQHAAMTQWMQQVHHYMGSQNPYQVNRCCGDYHLESSHLNPCSCHVESQSSAQSSHQKDDSSSSSLLDDENDCNDQQYEGISDEDESEYEYELNVDAILAMRAAKEELKKESSESEESFALVDDVQEEYEFIELGSLRHYGYSKLKLVGQRSANQEFLLEKQIMDQIYGEKSPTIAGLETAMSISFETLYDKHQPPLWPVLPVCL